MLILFWAILSSPNDMWTIWLLSNEILSTECHVSGTVSYQMQCCYKLYWEYYIDSWMLHSYGCVQIIRIFFSDKGSFRHCHHPLSHYHYLFQFPLALTEDQHFCVLVSITPNMSDVKPHLSANRELCASESTSAAFWFRFCGLRATKCCSHICRIPYSSDFDIWKVIGKCACDISLCRMWKCVWREYVHIAVLLSGHNGQFIGTFEQGDPFNNRVAVV
jgi:hypothetical protein